MVERIAAVAVRYMGNIYKGNFGGRHIHVVTAIAEEYEKWPEGHKEGFLTENGRFVGRAEAAEIAFAAGQTRIRLPILYSEDVYWPGGLPPLESLVK